MDVVVLDRVADLPQEQTGYCVHGRATCVRCGAWCWLGHATHDVVASRELAPLCRPCAREVVPADAVTVGNLGDHRRADGPH